jgi:VanZ family protein
MKVNIHRLAKVLIWIPVIIIGIMISGFSSQNGDESSGLSRRVAVALIQPLEKAQMIIIEDEEEREQIIESLQLPVRKGAHMSEYAIFTLSAYIALLVDGLDYRKRRWIAFFIAVLLACSDELHQLFVPGRSGKLTDVVIDSIGSLIMIFLITGIRRLIKKRI